MSRLMDIMDDYLGIYEPEPEYFTFSFLKERQRDSGPLPFEGRGTYKKHIIEPVKPIETRWSIYLKDPVLKIKTCSIYERIKEEREEKLRQQSNVKSIKLDWKLVRERAGYYFYDAPNQLTGIRSRIRGNERKVAY